MRAAGLRLARRAFSSSTSSSQPAVPKIFELRTYSIQPQHFGEFLSLTNEKIGLRTAHSPLIGYWTSEYGGLNEVVHIWEYDSYTQRAGVRKALAGDQEWQKSYMSKMTPMLQKQDNIVMYQLPFVPITKPKEGPNMYELRFYHFKPKNEGKLLQVLQEAVKERNKFSQPLGMWKTEFGPLSAVVHVWPYRSLEERHAIREQAQASKEFGELAAQVNKLTVSKFSKVLSPAPFSPLQ
eukprot:m.321477 g.321477  ORF g.321477 m.321477 type:complete len:237 (+) comp25422_c0_seq1:126-836(+)